jgi:hypothetical protein
VRLPHLRETIAQYASVVDRLSGNPETKEFMNALVDVLLTGDHLRQARDIRVAYTQALVVHQERMWSELMAVTVRDYPDMAAQLINCSLPTEPSLRRQRIERFYQPNARNRNYFGLYFRIPNFSHAVNVIEIEDRLYTGIRCLQHEIRERIRAAAALEAAGIDGEVNPTWAMWRWCALSHDLYDPDHATLDLLSNPDALRTAAESSMAQVYAAWLALRDSAVE